MPDEQNVLSNEPTPASTGSSIQDGSRIVRRALWLAYDSVGMEADYWREHRRRTCTLAGVFVGAVLLSFVVFAISDYRLFGATTELAWLATTRVALFLISVLVLVRISRTPTRRDLEWTLVIWGLVLVAGNSYIVSTRPPTYVGHALPSALFLLLGYSMLPSPWVEVTLPGCLVTGFYAILLLWSALPADKLTATAVLLALVTANVVGCVWSIQLEYS